MQTQIDRQEGEALLLTDPRREGQMPPADKILTRSNAQFDAKTLPEGLGAVMIAAIQQDATEAYAVQPKEGYYEAINTQHALRATFFPGGVGLISTDETGAWQWGMQLTGYGYGEKRERLTEATLRAEGNRVEYQRGTLTEWYLNGPLGLEQGFTLHEPPRAGQADEPLVLDLEFQSGWTLELDADRQHLILKQADGTHMLHYGHLYVTDATGRFLPVHLELLPGDAHLPQHMRIHVDDREAVYPIVIDPLVQTILICQGFELN